jgi:hypothetical protein|tara:strand:- start:303 stop:554 length:252 start_codon:yes stop_codon:yes gene_type:complete
MPFDPDARISFMAILDDTKVRLFVFLRFVLLTLFFCFASYRDQIWYNDVARTDFWQARVWKLSRSSAAASQASRLCPNVTSKN